MPSVLISILNWNKAETTLECLRSLGQLSREGIRTKVLVLDNGSAEADYLALKQDTDADWIEVRRSEVNLGFTGGHNVILKIAINEGYDFVWLLNNDATVQPDALRKLVDTMLQDARCGAASPVIVPEIGAAPVHGWGYVHEWKTRGRYWIPNVETAHRFHETAPERICLSGAAMMLRVDALRQVGLLDERLFAYYDDNDICTRLAQRGWHSRVAFDTAATHESRPITEQPPYYFYLMYRNGLIFWHSNMPKGLRRLLWLKIVEKALFNVTRLRQAGMEHHAECGLLGVWDFICGRTGAPDLGRKAPALARLLCWAVARMHAKKLGKPAANPVSA